MTAEGRELRSLRSCTATGTVSGNTVPTPVAYQDWTLSKLGNWAAWDNDGTSETRTHNNINALTARSTVANPLAYDANFNLIDDGENYTFEYDANDKLKIVRNRTTTAVVAEYRYDAFGRRVEKEVGSDITRYYHSGEQIIEERNGSDAVVATYSYGDYIDEPLTMDRASERYYYHTNRMYSVYALTDSAGDLIERYSYTPYGVTTTYDENYANSQPTSRVGNPYTYTGRELDSETLLMYNRNRIYDPVTGRFRQLDPIGFDGGDLNLYAYVRGIPTSYADPLGLKKYYADIVAKSFINGIPRVGSLYGRIGPTDTVLPVAGAPHGPAGQGIGHNPHAATIRLVAFAKAIRVSGLEAFHQNPDSDAKDGKYRLYTTARVTFCCEGDKLTSVQISNTDMEGGIEIDNIPLPNPLDAVPILYPLRGLTQRHTRIEGTINMTPPRVDRVDGSKVNVWWKGWGRPNKLLEPGMQAIAYRTSVNIWHQVDMDFQCNNGKGTYSVASFLGSKFPSRRLWVKSKLESDKPQGAFSDLWTPHPDDKTWVSQ